MSTTALPPATATRVAELILGTASLPRAPRKYAQDPARFPTQVRVEQAGEQCLSEARRVTLAFSPREVGKRVTCHGCDQKIAVQKAIECLA